MEGYLRSDRYFHPLRRFSGRQMVGTLSGLMPLSQRRKCRFSPDQKWMCCPRGPRGKSRSNVCEFWFRLIGSEGAKSEAGQKMGLRFLFWSSKIGHFSCWSLFPDPLDLWVVCVGCVGRCDGRVGGLGAAQQVRVLGRSSFAFVKVRVGFWAKEGCSGVAGPALGVCRCCRTLA